MNNNEKQEYEEKHTAEPAENFFGFDEESLLKEYDSAEQELREIQLKNPEKCEKPDAGFAELMKKINKENIEPIYLDDFSEKTKKKSWKSNRLKYLLRT